MADLENYPHGGRDQDGIIIVDHGLRRKESNLMLNEFVAMLRDETGYQIVEPAHMELAEPSIRDAFGSSVQQGANGVIVSPFFLFSGRHWHKDIPSLTANALKVYPGVPYIITAPLGLHKLPCGMLVFTLILQRLFESSPYFQIVLSFIFSYPYLINM
ncbi:sirohydrochlorin ferrochelatase, chloroplastic-like [Carica papaya]|uniref:sirohydrochlorin ferrochelatase, chloroplastic-like n=1 Tax=Carica papaya TaxID=3649 RepID=UPI000B8CA0E1|nr:sirohydrochlorin ferrochelatase, chloroplastic-like [Carica papaya]